MQPRQQHGADKPPSTRPHPPHAAADGGGRRLPPHRRLHYRAIDPVCQLRQARRGGGQRACVRGRHGALRRDGQPLCAQPDDRPAGVRRAAQARRHGAYRRAPDGDACGPACGRLHQGGGVVHHLSPRGQPPSRPHPQRHQGCGAEGRFGVQPRDAPRLAQVRHRQGGHRAAHVGQPRFRWTEVHWLHARQAERGQGDHRQERAVHPAGDRWRCGSCQHPGGGAVGGRHVCGGVGHIRHSRLQGDHRQDAG
mmetsp:Transcript_11964/g.34679  ORF Transcript_11964/g.34679 Transcript_11964/m.34679 type:complete len:251 (+) Transcript_11964:237-989(+)